MSRQDLKRAIRNQDEDLGRLHQSVTRLGAQSREIGAEIESQNQALLGLQDDVEDTANSLNLVAARTKDFLRKTANRPYCGVLAGLSILIIILLFLILYT